MALEDLLTKLTTALDANTAAHKASVAALAALPAGKAPTTTTTGGGKTATTNGGGGGGKTTTTFDEVKAAAAKVMDKQGKPYTKKLIKDVGGAPELATVKPEKYGALMAAFAKALEEGAAAPEEDEDEL